MGKDREAKLDGATPVGLPKGAAKQPEPPKPAGPPKKPEAPPRVEPPKKAEAPPKPEPPKELAKPPKAPEPTKKDQAPKEAKAESEEGYGSVWRGSRFVRVPKSSEEYKRAKKANRGK